MIVSVLGNQYYPQDVVLPCDPTYKSWRKKKPKIGLTELSVLLPSKKWKIFLFRKRHQPSVGNYERGVSRRCLYSASKRFLPLWRLFHFGAQSSQNPWGKVQKAAGFPERRNPNYSPFYDEEVTL
jgi:hypothetical protein